MTPAEIAAIRARLQALAEKPGLRATVAEAATDLAARIDAPVRVVLFGLPGSGKSGVLNRLLGRPLLPETMTLPTTLVERGDLELVNATLPDGSRRSFPGVTMAEVARCGAALVEISLTDPALDLFSLMEIVADASADDQLASMAWAARRTDIALWVSTGFAAEDAAIWRDAPDALKDNGYLVLTGPEAAPTAPAQDFRDSFHIGGPAGVEPLAEAVRRTAARGRQAYLDHALLFLNRYAPTPEPLPAAAPAPEPAPAPQPAPEPVANDPQSERPAAPKSRPISVPAPVTAPAAANASRPPTRQPVLPKVDVSGLCNGAVALLRERARDLSRALPGYGRKPAPQVFEHCLETVEALVETVTGAGLRDLEDLVLDTADAIVLLQGEGGTAQAADTVSLLLQLRRDLETRIAA